MYSTQESDNIKEINWQFFLNYVFKHSVIPDEETVKSCFSHLNYEYMEILAERFGLDGSERNSTLETRTCDKSAHNLYLRAFNALKGQYYVEKLSDKEDFTPSIACGLGMIACGSIGRYELKSFSGNALLLQMQIRLDKRRHEIMVLRYGLDGKGKKTLEHIGKIYNITRERVRQIENASLGLLAYPIRKHCNITLYDES